MYVNFNRKNLPFEMKSKKIYFMIKINKNVSLQVRLLKCAVRFERHNICPQFALLNCSASTVVPRQFMPILS